MSKNTDRIQCLCPKASTAGCKVSKPQCEALYAFVYVCVCVYIYIYIYIYIYVCVCVCVCVYSFIHVCLQKLIVLKSA